MYAYNNKDFGPGSLLGRAAHQRVFLQCTLRFTKRYPAVVCERSLSLARLQRQLARKIRTIADNQVQRYHFTLLRNLYEKTANFLGYPQWSELLPDDKQTYLRRIIQFTSHSTLSNEAVAEPTAQDKQTVKLLLDHLTGNYRYWQQQGTLQE